MGTLDNGEDVIRVHEVTDEELAEASPEYAAHLRSRAVDHKARAMRLLDLMDECYKLDDECLVAVDPPIELDMDARTPTAPDVPYRFAAVQWNGSHTWLIFDNDLEPLTAQLEGEIGDESPWAPGDVVDLDTGKRYGSFIKITLKPYTHRVSWSYKIIEATHKSVERYHSLEDAQASVGRLKAAGAMGIELSEITYET